MPDDICGYDGTTTGEPCRHPAGACPVPSHSDPEAENPQGREFTLGEDDHDDILDAARGGFSKAGCARAAGVAHSQLDRYVDAHPEFRAAFERARARGEGKLIQRGLHDEETDSSMAKFLLSTSFGYVKTEKREVDMDADVDLSGASFDIEFVDGDDD